MCNGIAPDPPQNLKVSEIQNETNVALQWDIPWNFYSELKSFIIHVDEIKSLTDIICCHIVDPVEIPFQDEKPTYEVTVMVFSCNYKLYQLLLINYINYFTRLNQNFYFSNGIIVFFIFEIIILNTIIQSLQRVYLFDMVKYK